MSRKTKFSLKTRLQAVKSIIDNHFSYPQVCDEFGVCRSQLQRWVRFYQLHGLEGLKFKSNNYSGDFKLQVLQEMEKRSLSLSETCLKFNIPSDSILASWVNKYKHYGISGLYQDNRGRPKTMSSKKSNKKRQKPLTREDELELENKSLRAELDYLKKLEALIQEEAKKKNTRH